MAWDVLTTLMNELGSVAHGLEDGGNSYSRNRERIEEHTGVTASRILCPVKSSILGL